MAVFFSYFLVVLIWGTTSLAIQWSRHSFSFIAAAFLSMSIALIIGLVINIAMNRKLFSQAGEWKAYAAGAIGVFPNIPIAYWSVQFIPSGLAVSIFSLSPFFTGLMSIWLLKQNPFTIKRVFALLLAVTGVIVIFHDQFQFRLHTVLGILGMLSSSIAFSFSNVLVKKYAVNVDAFNQTLGTLLFASPSLGFMWLLVDGQIPQLISIKSLLAISYLSLFTSLIGAALFFYVLVKMSPLVASFITFMTPVFGLILGVLIGHDVMSLQLWIGVILIAFAMPLNLEMSSNWFFVSLTRGAWKLESVLQSINLDAHRFR